MRILLDMDEVLCDFVGPYAKVWGLTREAVIAEWEPGVWDMVPPLSAALHKGLLGSQPGYPIGWVRDYSVMPLTQSEFWAAITNNAHFWEGLPKLPWCDELLDLVRSITDDWHLVTSPGPCGSSAAGKTEWVKKLGVVPHTRITFTWHKHLLAKPGAVLIDDRESTCDQFGNDGGLYVLFPRHHNSRHWLKEDPMRVVRNQLAMVESYLEESRCT